MNRRQAYNVLKGFSGVQGAKWLLERITGSTNSFNMGSDLAEHEIVYFNDVLSKLQAGEPIQYILGDWDFFGFRFNVDSRALIPRPETELLVERALGIIDGYIEPRVADLGTGTGCIGIVVKLKRPDATVSLIDISPDACSLARVNAEMLKADVLVENCDMRALDGKYDLILSNPPYIKIADIEKLDDSVRRYEPMLALDGGQDGFDYYRELAVIAARCLTEDGNMVIEIGAGQRAGIEKIFESFQSEFIKDFQGIDRISIIHK